MDFYIALQQGTCS